MTSETTAKKDIQKLQRAIVDGLEDVKGQDIVVFNTAELSPLFERVIIASGTSNRQTKALASSVSDAVKEAGFPKPRIEGEENGEWIIVDCGQAVAHVMQPTIRAYYHLEEIWGGKAVKLKSSVPAKKTAAKTSVEPAESATKAPAKRAARKATAAPAVTDVAPAKAPARKAAPKSAAAAPAAAAPKAVAKKPVAKKTAVAKIPARASAPAAPAKKAATKPATKLKTVVVGAPAKKAAAKAPAAKAAAKPARRKPAA